MQRPEAAWNEVWVAPHSREVVEGEPDEDGLIPTYPKIMDVRPA